LDIDTEIILSILKLAKNGSLTHEELKNDLRFPLEAVSDSIKTLQNEGQIHVCDDVIRVADVQRFELAVRALKKGVDIEKVTALLHWREFETMAALAFDRNGYSVTQNLHFKHTGRRYEIDVVGCKNSSVVCVDCKHWHHAIGRSTLERVVKEQVKRVRALSCSLPNPRIKIECSSRDSLRFMPVVLSLIMDKSKFCDGVPIVSIIQLQDFLNQLPAYEESIMQISAATLDKPRSSQSRLD
jgi:Holliday junction resolvase-like predicted endonuclease